MEPIFPIPNEVIWRLLLDALKSNTIIQKEKKRLSKTHFSLATCLKTIKHEENQSKQLMRRCQLSFLFIVCFIKLGLAASDRFNQNITSPLNIGGGESTKKPIKLKLSAFLNFILYKLPLSVSPLNV